MSAHIAINMQLLITLIATSLIAMIASRQAIAVQHTKGVARPANTPRACDQEARAHCDSTRSHEPSRPFILAPDGR
jgi:hypothetical protein